MLRGVFTIDDLRDATGLAYDTLRELVNSLLSQSAIVLVEKRAPTDRICGNRIRVFELVRL